MLAELIFMIEKGHAWRLSNLEKIRHEGRLPPAYETGLATIATWLGTDVGHFLDATSPKDLDRMRAVFRQQVTSITEETKV